MTLSASIGVAFVLGAGVLLRESTFDLPAVRAFNLLHIGVGAAIGSGVYQALSPIPAILGLIVIAVLLTVLHRGIGPASTIAATVAVTWLSSAAVKALIARPRPDAAALRHPSATPADASYPSGHTVFVVALVIAVVLVTRSSRWGRVWAIVGAALVLVLAFSVMSDGVHYPTDVIAGVVWAIALAPFVAALWTRYVLPRVPLLHSRSLSS